MWQAIKKFFMKIFWPSTSTLFNRLTPIVAKTAVVLAQNKANEIVGRTSRKCVEEMLLDELRAKSLLLGVDYALNELEDATKLAIKKANED